MQEFIINIVKQNAVDIVGILTLFFLGRKLLKVMVKRLVSVVDDGDDAHLSQKEKRAETLGHIIITTGNIAIYVVILLMALSLFGINITPVLAGAGVIGLAIGFGAQSLVKDFVSGFFILVENQYGIGDKVKIGSFEGRVVRITMRSTVLKNDKEETYYTSNGLIKDVINMSQNKVYRP
ncbi:MAG: mechanosensitive ion channel [Candidatus Pacebacteria bacterium]|nr:mechanosensitive ion channel [Candidatus Paceibacterota bacterium]